MSPTLRIGEVIELVGGPWDGMTAIFLGAGKLCLNGNAPGRTEVYRMREGDPRHFDYAGHFLRQAWGSK